MLLETVTPPGPKRLRQDTDANTDLRPGGKWVVLTTRASCAWAGGMVMVLATTNCPWDLDEALRSVSLFAPPKQRRGRLLAARSAFGVLAATVGL